MNALRGLARCPLVGLLIAMMLAMLAGWPGVARSAAVRVEAVELELVAQDQAVRAGQRAWLGLRIKHDPHWHTYWLNPGDSGLPTRLDLEVPAGVQAGPLQWPAPQRLFIPPLANYGYEGEVVLPFTLDVPPGQSSPLRLRAQAAWLMCRDVCIPGEAELSIELALADQAVTPRRSPHAALFDQAFARLPRGSVKASVFADGDRLSLGLPAQIERAGQLRPVERFEFFPFLENALVHAAPQIYFELDRADGLAARRLQLTLSNDGQKRVTSGADALASAAQGVLVSGDWVVSVDAQASVEPLAGGREIGRIAGAPEKSLGSGTTGSRLGLTSPAGTARPGSPGLFDSALKGSGASGAPAAATSTGSGETRLGVSILFAMLGGLILNLMPCVFPVVGLKVLSFATPGQSPARSAIAFTAGVMLSFWLLAGGLIALRAAGVAAGWGFQLQSPAFVAAMAMLFVLIGLNFAGLFEVGVGLTRLARFDSPSPGSTRSSSASALGSGALAVVVATPCTAPFMGSALGFALTASLPETFAIFTALGLGMSLPYLLLGAFPAWLRFMPRPGRWMESLKQFLAFPMFATVAWLVWVLGQQAGIDAVLGFSMGAVLLALAAWIYGRFIQQTGRWSPLATIVLAIAVGASFVVAWPRDDLLSETTMTPATSRSSAADKSGDPAAWEPWSPQRVGELLAAGRPVFVDFTAAWCVTCQVNKKAVLDRPPVVQAMHAAGVVRLKADWTRRDATITAELNRWGRSGVPLYLYFPAAGRPPRILPELLTDELVLAALRESGPVAR
ncbi:MAG: Thiol:disulfide interchange protein DsbD [Pseudomonadota bacterium]|jgi:thiol:disulfide interchange protein DsbD